MTKISDWLKEFISSLIGKRQPTRNLQPIENPDMNKLERNSQNMRQEMRNAKEEIKTRERRNQLNSYKSAFNLGKVKKCFFRRSMARIFWILF